MRKTYIKKRLTVHGMNTKTLMIGTRAAVEKKLRIEDALNSTRAAVEEGIVSGGGTALINVYNAVEAVQAEGDEKTGVNIVLRALEEPVRTIATNAGLEGSVVVERLKKEQPGVGFNAATGEWVNMIDAGIVDPAKVTRSALQNAASVAALFPQDLADG